MPINMLGAGEHLKLGFRQNLSLIERDIAADLLTALENARWAAANALSTSASACGR
ncbi:hypothetical protein [Afipia felis]